MPIRWTPEADQHLLLKILETANVKVDYAAVARAWTYEDDVPTAKAINERISRLRRKAQKDTPGKGSEAGRRESGATVMRPAKPRTQKPKMPATTGKDHRQSANVWDAWISPWTIDLGMMERQEAMPKRKREVVDGQAPGGGDEDENEGAKGAEPEEDCDFNLESEGPGATPTTTRRRDVQPTTSANHNTARNDFGRDHDGGVPVKNEDDQQIESPSKRIKVEKRPTPAPTSMQMIDLSLEDDRDGVNFGHGFGFDAMVKSAPSRGTSIQRGTASFRARKDTPARESPKPWGEGDELW